MRLITPYAPGSFSKPCVVISTLAVEGICETIVRFVEALNANHALEECYGRGGQEQESEWVQIKQHASREEAVAFHLDLVKDFHNGGSEAEWEAGWTPYLALYNQWAPQERTAS